MAYTRSLPTHSTPPHTQREHPGRFSYDEALRLRTLYYHRAKEQGDTLEFAVACMNLGVHHNEVGLRATSLPTLTPAHTHYTNAAEVLVEGKEVVQRYMAAQLDGMSADGRSSRDLLLDFYLHLASASKGQDQVELGIEYLEQHFNLYLETARNNCAHCRQVRDLTTSLWCCKNCSVSRYCSAEHQKEHWKEGDHSAMCAYYKAWRQVLKGKLSQQDGRDKLRDFLTRSVISTIDEWDPEHPSNLAALNNADSGKEEWETEGDWETDDDEEAQGKGDGYPK